MKKELLNHFLRHPGRQKLYPLLLFFFVGVAQAVAATGVANPGETIFEPQKTFSDSLATSLAEKIITGTVTDNLGSPLIGVNIYVKNTPGIGTASDINGKYILEIPDGNTILVFQMIGFKTKEFNISDKEVLNVTMEDDLEQLEEVVVTAFGETRGAKEMVGSVTTVKASDLKVPSSNLTTALAGRASGIIAYQRSGEPGQDNANFFIRGATSFGYTNNPLILIDGIELSTNDLARLNPDDIASFSIMKDAASTALYGARGANGVILVTTKSGKVGKAKIDIRIENSISAPTQNVDLADPVTYMKLHSEAVLTRDPLGQGIMYNEDKIANTAAGVNPYMYPAVDWRETLIKDYTQNQRMNLNVSGGGGVARYFVAGSYSHDNGLLKVDKKNNFNNNIDLKTYTLRSNVNIDVSNTTELIVRLSGAFDDYTGPISGGAATYRNVMRTNPVLFPAYYPKDEDHQFTNHILFGNYEVENDLYLNPYAEMVKGYKEYSRSMMLAQFEVKQDLALVTEGLSFRGLLNTTRNSYFEVNRNYNPFYYSAGSYDKLTNTFNITSLNEDSGTEWLNYSQNNPEVNSTFYLESALNYNRTFGKHTLSGMMIYIMRQKLSASGNASTLQLSLPYRNIGLSGRATYSFDNRYFAEFNFGYNGSERFHESLRFGFFPAVGLAWSISNEKFFDPVKHIFTNLRLRGSYGIIGQDAIGSAADRFFYLSQVDMNNGTRGAVFGTDNGYQRNGVHISRYANADITWETSTKKNIALELGIFDKFDIIAEYFTEHRENILMTRAYIPYSMGLSANMQANVGEASGKGIELSLDYQEYFTNDFWVQGMANFTYSTSEFEVYEEPNYGVPNKSHLGYPVNQQWGYIAERLFVDDEEVANSAIQDFGDINGIGGGDIKYHDVNGDGQITTLDQVPLGYPTVPEIVYGFGASVGYKNFDVSAFFQGLARETFWIDVNATAPFVKSGNPIRENQLLQAYADDHWSEENRNIYALWPRLSTVPIKNNSQRSSWFMRDGSFLRLKSAEIGYTLPQRTVDRLRMEKLRIYFSGTNLFTWSKFNLWDVEMGGNGLGYPLQRVINVGINASF